ncbi:MAG TPA: helix-turn-helix transcriptional regulator [Candidatus Polarisedimenticolaceae bacterium]|nr:helix-turn-helix transcriptional regulator [Candidatus Polarisedimenticolaceae bacterium]
MAMKLPNYLRTFRKRAYLTQDELAFLLGTESGTRVSRYEQFDREPGLETALAYQVIFAESSAELFAGLYERIAHHVGERASALVLRLEGRSPNPVLRHKLEVLRDILRRVS